ncbi:hypothetical protein GLOIN_2v1470948 [Rhizophagus irregularis DAOM 181602=DAOM 197198]|nr:hypothetical protein GLOIN_2v1470948 [Rhizophagus irregularis DAOM 181602=DAOM 197198]
MCLSGRSPCEKEHVEVQPTFRKKLSRKITQNKESMMSSTTSNIHLVCFVRGETGKDIFPVVIDNNSTVENLGVEIRKVRQDLSQKNFNLYVRKFKQPNHGLVNTVNTTEKKQGELMEPPNKFTYYFSVEDIKGLKKNPPYLLFMLSYTSRKCWKKIPRILGSSESESKLVIFLFTSCNSDIVAQAMEGVDPWRSGRYPCYCKIATSQLGRGVVIDRTRLRIFKEIY